MSWLSNFVRPKLRALIKKSDSSSNLWIKCNSCGQMVYHKDLQDTVHVCPNCGHHMKMSARQRIEWILDEDSIKELTIPKIQEDPLKFKDSKKYTDRIKDAKSKSKSEEAIIIASGMAAIPPGGAEWSLANAGKGGLILWPLFGATNQLLAGLSFLVITFYLWRRGRAVWFLVIPMIFMLIMPIWAMTYQLFFAPGWLIAEKPNMLLGGIGLATIALEIWMIVEAIKLFPKAKGLLEENALDQKSTKAAH